MVVVTDWVRLLIVCLVFTAAAGVVGWAGGLLSPRPMVAALRAAAQLAAVSAVITVVLVSLPLTEGHLSIDDRTCSTCGRVEPLDEEAGRA